MLWTLPVWLAPNRLIGLPGDPVSNAWNAAWVPYALTHGLNPYQSAYLNAPFGINNMWPAPTMLYILIVWPLTMLVSPTLGYNAIMLLAMVGTGVAAFALMTRFTTRLWLAVWASCLFTFGPYEVSEATAGHVDLAAVGSLLLLVLLIDELVRVRTWQPRTLGLCIAATLIGQMLTSEELLGTAVLMASLGALLAAPFRFKLDRSSAQYMLRSLKWAAVATPCMLAFAAYQWLAPGALHGPNASPAVFSVPLITYFVPGPSQLLSVPWATGITQFVWGTKQELTSYVGLGVIVTLALGARRVNDTLLRWALAMLLVSALLAAGPAVPLRGGFILPAPEALLAMLPLVGDILPVRLGVYVDLFSALALVMVLDQVKCANWVRYSAAAVVALTWIPAVPAPAVKVATPTEFSRQPSLGSSSTRASDVVLVLPYVASGATDNAMLWQAAAHFTFRMPEGYWVRLTTSQAGNRYGPAVTRFTDSLLMIAASGHRPAMTASLRADAIAYLRRHDVRAVVLGPSPHESTLRGFIDWVLGASPSYTGGVAVWRVS